MSPNAGIVISEAHQKVLGPVKEVESYVPGEGEILVKAESVAQNPVDWKQVDYNFAMPGLPFINGVDVVGTVETVGEGVGSFAPGDRVACMAVIGKEARFGAFQRFSIQKALVTVKVPPSLSSDDASTFPLAYYTAAVGLFTILSLPLPGPKLDKEKPAVLVWGGSSSVGALAVQLANLAGAKVIATSSPRNFEYVKKCGAGEVFDYHDSDVVEKIKAAAPNLRLVFDAITEHGSTETAMKSFASGGSVAIVLPYKGDVPEGVTVQVVYAGSVIGDAQKCAPLRALFQTLLDENKLLPHPVHLMPNGLNSLNEGFQLMRDGKVSGEKIVYRPWES